MPRYQKDPVPYAHGIDEKQLHQASGLRLKSFSALISTAPGGIVNATPIGTASAGADTGDFPTDGLREFGSTTWQPNLPVPMTPTVFFFVLPHNATLPQSCTVRVKARGYDQFGNYIEEVTPVLSKTLSNGQMWFAIHLSKVFSALDNVWIATTGISNLAGVSTAAVGWCTQIDPTSTEGISVITAVSGYMGVYWSALTPAQTTTGLDWLNSEANWGIGTPFLMSPYGPNIPFPSCEIVGAQATLLRQKTTPTVINNTQRLPARGQLVVAGAAPTTGVAIGRSAAGWQGTPHKVGFFSNDGWTTKISGIDLGGASLRASGRPTTDGQVGEDDLMLTFQLRTAQGLQAGSNATKSYRD